VLTAREERLREAMIAVTRALGCAAAAKAAVARHPDVLMTRPVGIDAAMGALEREFGRHVAVVAATRHARLLACRAEVIEQLAAPLVELLGREQTVAAVAHSPELLMAHKGRAGAVMATLRDELGCVTMISRNRGVSSARWCLLWACVTQLLWTETREPRQRLLLTKGALSERVGRFQGQFSKRLVV
jgi:hypothetical protein